MTKEIVIIYEYVKCARRDVERKEFNGDERKNDREIEGSQNNVCFVHKINE